MNVSAFESDTAAAIVTSAGRHGLDPYLVAALVMRESAGRSWAWNPEPRYAYLWDVEQKRPFRKLTVEERTSCVPPPDFPTMLGDRDQEWWGQRASWGLMQVMGAVAREGGFLGPFLTELCDPVVGCEFGCRHLSRLVRRWPLEDALSAYNAGTPTPANEERYVRWVLVRAEQLRREGGL